ncbi:MAG: PKD domain-containing protein [Candidatus Bipolaricaulis anaerobius]
MRLGLGGIRGNVVFSPDGRYLAVGTSLGIELRDSQTLELVRFFSGHTSDVYSVAFSPDGSLLASGSDDNTIKLWEVATGRLVRTLTGHTWDVYSVAFSPDGSLLASASYQEIKLWDVATGRLVRTLTGHTGSVLSVAFSPDGKLLASGSDDNTIKLWEVATGRLVRTLTGHTGSVRSVAFSPDGSLLASGSSDGTVLLWDVQAFLYPNQPPMASFTWEALSPEGTRLLVQPRTGDRIRFDASGSSDPDGRITKYEWDWTSDGTYDLPTTNPVTEYRFSTSGSHKVTLRVTDDQGATATTTQTVGIGEKRSPVAGFTFAPSSPSTLDTVQFTDTSSDPDGTITGWQWEFGDGATSTAKDPTHRYSAKRTFTVKLTVIDNDGQSATTTKTVIVVNLAPEAFFTFSPKEPYAGKERSFDASGSQDKDGKIVNHAWDFTGDGKPDREGVQVTWAFPEPGTYPISLTVTDDDGAMATSRDTLQVTLSPEPVEAKRVWAVVVGISEHREPSLNLRYARRDAEAFYRWLTETARLPEDQVQLLLDSKAILTEVRASLDWLRRRADPDDLVIFYFAGHGYQGTDLDPVDEEDKVDEYFVLYDTKRDAIEATALRDDEFGQFLDRLLSQHVLVVFDSCHAGGGERGDRGLPRGARPVGETLDIWGDFNLEGKLVLAAAKEDQLSYENAELGQGVFTHFLLQGLEGQADENSDGKVTVQELYGYVATEVPRYVREKVGEVQEPQLTGRGTPQVVLAKANRPPNPGFTTSPEVPFPGKEVAFHDTTTDDGTITAWTWNFGDGTTSTDQHPTHAYAEPGTYTITLTVTDDGGLTATATKELTVGPRGEVTAIDLARNLVTISLGSKHGVQVGDQFEVIHVITLPDGTQIEEVRASIEIIHVASPDRSVCRVLTSRYPAEIGDRLRAAR